jgi:hypothetical protein
MFVVLFWLMVTVIAGGFFALMEIFFDWRTPPQVPVGVQAARLQLELAQVCAEIEGDAIRLRRELDVEMREIGDWNG